MVKNILMLIVLSVAAIFFQDQLMQLLKVFMYVHAEIAKGLGVIFSINAVGEVVQSVLALLLIPAVVGIIIAIAHFFIRQQHFPHTMTVIWVCWAVFLAAILSQTGHVTNQDISLHGHTATPTAPAVPGAPGAPGAPHAPGAPGTPGTTPGAPGKPSAAPVAPVPAHKSEW